MDRWVTPTKWEEIVRILGSILFTFSYTFY